MTRQLDVDRLIEDWLTEGPVEMPARALDGIFDHLANTRQRRPWRLPGSVRMHRVIYSVTGVAAAVLVAVVALISFSNGTNEPAGPSASPFTSERHGYTLTLPDDRWRVQERVGRWEIGNFFLSDSEGVDHVQRLADDGSVVESGNLVYLSSQAIPEGLPYDEWLESHDRSRARDQACFEQQGPYRQTFVDGEQVRLGDYICDAFEVPWPVVEAVFGHEGRGYVVYVMPYDTADAIPLENLRLELADWLGRFSFTTQEGTPDA
jgi:hypothetical protein